MSREADLLFGLLALQMGFISKDQLLACAAVWMSDPSTSLADILLRREFVRDDQEAALRGMVEAQIRQHGGDGGKALGSRQSDAGIAEELLRMSDSPAFQETLSAIRHGPAPPPAPTHGDGLRYRLGAELGRGGLGRVVEAQDTRLKRTVAVKLILDGLHADLRERFVREAELAGRLEHPNIVPIYDFGNLPGPDGQVFMAMKRVRGRNLAQILRSLRKGEPGAREAWSRLRLLQIFQDICQGVAFAHDRSVVHRDLKPANVMIGDYGETLILDWGLARVTSEPPSDLSLGGTGNSESAGESRGTLTLDGEVLGTPSYMPPEQADGRMADVDHRSDIYSLGAILYEILTWHPPVDGKSVEAILSKVRNGEITPPSRRQDAPLLPGGSGETARAVLRVSGRGDLPAPVPAELEAICMKALSFERSARQSSALELHRDIQLFLEGVRDAERRALLADEAAARAEAAAARAAELHGTLPAAREEVVKARDAWSRRRGDGKGPLWDAQDRETRLLIEVAEAAAAADAAAAEALGHDPTHPAARQVKAAMAWMRFEDSEEEGHAAAMVAHRRVVEHYNDGAFDERLRGEGRLRVRTMAFPCSCLRSGRRVEPGDLAWEGWHPFSGRSLKSPQEVDGIPALEPSATSVLRAHASDCRPQEQGGAHVWLWKYEEAGRLRIPVTPGNVCPDPGSPVPPLDAVCPPNSPVRPRGPGWYAGRTPIQDLALPMGSWLLLVARDGFAPRRVPVRVRRLMTSDLQVTLFAPEEVPPGCATVQGGHLILAGDRGNPLSPPARPALVPDFFYAVHSVTCAEYAAFLEATERKAPGSARRHAPRGSEKEGEFWPGPPWEVPTAERLATWPPGRAARARRIERTPFDWQDDWPVLSVSWQDAMAYCAWRREVDGRPWTLATSQGWERSVRGDDQRVFSTGDFLDSSWANGLFSFPKGHPTGPGEFLHDESPFGLRNLSGNVRTLCLDRDAPPGLDWRAARGGDWAESDLYARCSFYAVQDVLQVAYTTGFRLAVPIRLG